MLLWPKRKMSLFSNFTLFLNRGTFTKAAKMIMKLYSSQLEKFSGMLFVIC